MSFIARSRIRACIQVTVCLLLIGHSPSLDDPSLVSTHAAALLFIIFGLATLFDPEAVPYSPTAKEYFLLSRLALRFSSPILDTTLWAVQTMVGR